MLRLVKDTPIEAKTSSHPAPSSVISDILSEASLPNVMRTIGRCELRPNDSIEQRKAFINHTYLVPLFIDLLKDHRSDVRLTAAITLNRSLMAAQDDPTLAEPVTTLVTKLVNMVNYERRDTRAAHREEVLEALAYALSGSTHPRAFMPLQYLKSDRVNASIRVAASMNDAAALSKSA